MKPYMSFGALLLLLLFLFPRGATAQQKPDFEGQLSGYTSVNPGANLPVLAGLRYLPQVSYGIGKEDTSYFDLELSANVFATTQFQPFDSFVNQAAIRPYRAWVRYSTAQFEVRVGLQKINFGSANILRPLMWFDQIDPRDPLQITNGVYGVLGRYYFLNNANLWVWGLYGNENVKGWEQTETVKRLPEFGGRFQFPVSKGELALSFHNRTAQSLSFPVDSLQFDRIPEQRIGLDGKWDLGIGLWFESSYIRKATAIGPLTNQLQVNLGLDYTFGLGNGLNVMAEQLLFAYDETAFAFENPSLLTAATLTYPLTFYDNLSGVVFYDWTNERLFTFVNWSHQFKALTLNLIGYWNPDNGALLQQNDGANGFSGRGIQVLLIYHH